MNNHQAILLYLAKFDGEIYKLPPELRPQLKEVKNILLDDLIQVLWHSDIPIANYVRFYNVVGRFKQLN